MNTVRIIQATEEHLGLLQDFICALADYEQMSHAVQCDEPGLRAAFFGPHPVAEASIAWSDGHAAGFAVSFPVFSTFRGRPGLYIEDLFVYPEFRGSGLGKALLAHLARMALGRDWDYLEWQVLDWNEHAIAFYERLGALRREHWHNYRLADAPLWKLAGTCAPGPE